MRIRLEWKPQDLWIGAFWKQGHLWICFIPCLPIHFSWVPDTDEFDGIEESIHTIGLQLQDLAETGDLVNQRFECLQEALRHPPGVTGRLWATSGYANCDACACEKSLRELVQWDYGDGTVGFVCPGHLLGQEKGGAG